jgi:hypothetical protein
VSGESGGGLDQDRIEGCPAGSHKRGRDRRLPGRGGEEPPGPEPPAAAIERIDSANAFMGERREVALAIERFEAATRRRDKAALCNRILAVAGDEFGLRSRDPETRCGHDPEFAPGLELRGAGGRAGYDLAVRRVEIDSRKDRFKADAIARVGMPSEAPNPVELFDLQRIDGRWRVYARSTPTVRRQPGVIADLRCADDSRPVSFSTDVITLAAHAKPRAAAEVVLRTARRATAHRSSRSHDPYRALYRVLAGLHPSDLVRSAIGYGYARATYELRDAVGAPLARFELERFDDQYFLWRHEHCRKLLASAGF